MSTVSIKSLVTLSVSLSMLRIAADRIRCARLRHAPGALMQILRVGDQGSRHVAVQPQGAFHTGHQRLSLTGEGERAGVDDPRTVRANCRPRVPMNTLDRSTSTRPA